MQNYHEFYKNRNVLVTGGAGFIGSHLCEYLVNLGAQVRILDNLSTGKLENINGFSGSIEFIQGTITSLDDCLKAAHGIDTIFHLAAEVSVAESHKNPHPALTINVQGTSNILEAARIQGVKMVVFASSAAVYGNHEGRCSEKLLPTPVSTYGYAKLIGEQLCQLHSKAYNIKTVSLRYFNVYGPRQNPKSGDGGVLAVFEEKLKNNEPLVIFGDGLQTRDFVPVHTIVQATLKAGTLPESLANGQPFNVGTGASVTLMSKLQELLKSYEHYTQPITHMAARPGDIRHSACDCSKLQKAVF
jgi:nucleoside-diphosphate-sugar epimerase